MLVDCGLFQGAKELRLRNWEPFPVEPGRARRGRADPRPRRPLRLPAGARAARLRGPVSMRRPTPSTLAGIVLPDSGRLQEEDAAYANRRGFSQAPPPRAAVHRAEAERFARRCFDGLPVRRDRRDRRGRLGDAASARATSSARPASSSSDGERRPPRRVQRRPRPHDPSAARAAGAAGGVDVVLVESTYGDRLHDDAGALEALADAIRRTAARGGTVVIPAFAVDRTEVVLFHLRELLRGGPHPRAAGLRRQPDGALGAAASIAERSPRAGPSSGPSCGRADGDVLGDGDGARGARRRGSKAIDRHDWPVDRDLRHPEWPRAAASCTTWPVACPTRATPSFSSGFQAVRHARPHARRGGA